ncbi:hypothetical protein [Streptomyces sp. NPDC001604]|uniref:hypothetical protein n=1 Tax=Streptomyces sp. NPDC001604 TaxID=3364593 RepID=UPI0036904E4E
MFAWAENSGNYSWWDRTVPSYGFYTRNSGQNCASADGVVTNWCQYADSRVLGAYRTSGLIGFSFNAKQDSSHPFPYTRFVWFNESDKNLNGSGDLWGSWGAIQFASLAPNSLGRVGLDFAWGGGTGTTHYYPGSAINSQPANAIDTGPNYYLWGAGNTCTYSVPDRPHLPGRPDPLDRRRLRHEGRQLRRHRRLPRAAQRAVLLAPPAPDPSVSNPGAGRDLLRPAPGPAAITGTAHHRGKSNPYEEPPPHRARRPGAGRRSLGHRMRGRSRHRIADRIRLRDQRPHHGRRRLPHGPRPQPLP